MARHFAALCLLIALLVNPAHAAEPGVCEHCTSSDSTLRLYFPPNVMTAGHDPAGFKPEVAKVYVEDLYVGDVIVNLHGYVPTFRFPKSTVKIRIEMADSRKFETKITFLGHGSTQFLAVNFPDRKTLKSSGTDSGVPSEVSATQPSDN